MDDCEEVRQVTEIIEVTDGCPFAILKVEPTTMGACGMDVS